MHFSIFSLLTACTFKNEEYFPAEDLLILSSSAAEDRIANFFFLKIDEILVKIIFLSFFQDLIWKT